MGIQKHFNKHEEADLLVVNFLYTESLAKLLSVESTGGCFQMLVVEIGIPSDP